MEMFNCNNRISGNTGNGVARYFIYGFSVMVAALAAKGSINEKYQGIR
jgi:hypothetical protein